MSPQRSRTHLTGVILVTISAVLWSTAGLFVRGIALDVWTLVAWRSLFAVISMAGMAVLLGDRGRSWRERLDWRLLVYAPIAASSMLCFIASLRLTSVASVMMVYASVPFIAAGIAYLLLRERVSRAVLAASAVAVAGVVLTVAAPVAGNDLYGSVLALFMTICFASTLVLARRWPQLDLTLGTALACALCGAVCWLFAVRAVPTAAQLGWIALFSLATQSVGYLLFVIGARYTSAAEAGFIGLLDAVLAPFWVWLAFDEKPPVQVVCGGVLVLCSVAWYIARDARQARAAPSTAQATLECETPP